MERRARWRGRRGRRGGWSGRRARRGGAGGVVVDGGVRDGGVRDGGVRDGGVRDGGVRDGGARPASPPRPLSPRRRTAPTLLQSREAVAQTLSRRARWETNYADAHDPGSASHFLLPHESSVGRLPTPNPLCDSLTRLRHSGIDAIDGP
jgi:hypothetical protein